MQSPDKTILVTGGAGYIGSHVCMTLAKEGFLPVTYDNLCSGNKDAVQWGPLEMGDLRDRMALSKVIKKYKPAAIMHFAALIQVGASVEGPAEFYDNNVNGSFCLLEEARINGIDKMVFSSTAAVYGNPQTRYISEDHPTTPINPYGRTKLIMENMIRDYSSAYGLDFAILRYFNAAGADLTARIGTSYQKDTHLVPLLMRVAGNMMSEISVFGSDYPTPDGTAVRDYVHVVDLANAHILALKYIMEGKRNLTLNLGTSSGTSVLDVIKATRHITRQEIPSVVQTRRSGDPAVLVADATRASMLLNWTPAHSNIETIISSAWAWRQKQNRTATVIVRKDRALSVPGAIMDAALKAHAPDPRNALL